MKEKVNVIQVAYKNLDGSSYTVSYTISHLDETLASGAYVNEQLLVQLLPGASRTLLHLVSEEITQLMMERVVFNPDEEFQRVKRRLQQIFKEARETIESTVITKEMIEI
jgi:hypothetical protein